MQLAASQRAHPPPVPPRPSRQIVADALKTKSTRPPCPTRQAPPPPNQRPWRLEEQEKNGAGSSGRTIVYESGLQHPMAKVSNPRRPSVGEEKPRPVSRDLPARPTVNGVIDDTSKRKAEDNVNSHNNNNNHNCGTTGSGSSSLDSDRDLCDESPTRLLEECGSEQRKRKKKALNVTIREEHNRHQQRHVVEAVIEHHQNNKDTSPPAKIECQGDGATVVVIDEPERGSNSQEEHDNIRRQDWLEAGVPYSSTVVVVNGFSRHQQPQREDGDEELEEEEPEVQSQLGFGDLDFSSIIERIAMSSLQGLPPLPRSLSGFNLNGAGLVDGSAPPPPARSTSKASQQRSSKTPSSTSSLSSQGSTRPSPQGRQLTTLDTQLAILRREMFGLRQLDLSLLSQLWSLNESIQEFRQLLQEQEQEDRAPSPSPSSEEGDDTSYGGSIQPPPPPRRPAPSTPHRHQQQHHHHHHHRASRSNRSSKLMSPSDESPSSEEYGAI